MKVTDEMCKAGYEAYLRSIKHPRLSMQDVFEAMLKAAPTPPAQGEHAGYRLTYKSGKTQLIDRAPDSFEIRECKIEPVIIAAIAAPATPAPEIEPVLYQMRHANLPKWVNCSKAVADTFAARNEGHEIRPLYTHPASDGLRKAAEEYMRVTKLAYMRFKDVEHDTAYIEAEVNLRGELNKGKS